ncbi:MAG: mechanosensitive ion channel [Lachnospiraceae bacterium]|nr:mechanosensitive ion channel [Lachnospiraceae bacterium]
MVIDDSGIDKVLNDVFGQFLGKSGLKVMDFCENAILSLLILIIGFRVVKYIDRLVERFLVRSNVDAGLRTFLLSALRIILKVVLIFWAITNMGVAQSSIMAALGSAAIGIGLSLQGALSNTAGGVIILMMKPFQVGDYIMEEATGKEGTVHAIGIMYTKLLTVDNKEIMIPNGSLANTSITNLTGQTRRNIDIRIGIDYNANIKEVKEILTSIAENDQDRIPGTEVTVFVAEFMDSCISMGLRYWVPTEKFWPSKWRTNEAIKEEFDKHGISIPYNILDVNVKNYSVDH